MIKYSAIAVGKLLLVTCQKRDKEYENMVASVLRENSIKLGYQVFFYQEYEIHAFMKDQMIYLCITKEAADDTLSIKFLKAIRDKFCSSPLHAQIDSAESFAFQQDFESVLAAEMVKENTSTEQRLLDRAIQIGKTFQHDIDDAERRVENLDERSRLLFPKEVVQRRESCGCHNRKIWISLAFVVCLLTVTVVILFATDVI